MAKVFPINPTHPERICWGCDKYCPVGSLACGNGSERTQHPAELWGEDWQDWGPGAPAASAGPATGDASEPARGADTAASTADGVAPDRCR